MARQARRRSVYTCLSSPFHTIDPRSHGAPQVDARPRRADMCETLRECPRIMSVSSVQCERRLFNAFTTLRQVTTTARDGPASGARRTYVLTVPTGQASFVEDARAGHAQQRAGSAARDAPLVAFCVERGAVQVPPQARRAPPCDCMRRTRERSSGACTSGVNETGQTLLNAPSLLPRAARDMTSRPALCARKRAQRPRCRASRGFCEAPLTVQDGPCVHSARADLARVTAPLAAVYASLGDSDDVCGGVFGDGV
ncbi:hypothetical protein BD413DRAFT_192337 [Trametes elegans]|nr:hypothetical protein BD413DRAFT_192337 [Trametes elegans]